MNDSSPKLVTISLAGAVCSLLLFALFALIFSGCRSGTGGSETPTMTPARVEAISRLAAYAGATADMRENPEHRRYYVAARDALDVLIQQQRWDLEAVMAALSTVPVDGLDGSEGALILTGGLLLVDAIGGEKVDLRQVEYVRAAAVGIHGGLKLALATKAVARAGPIDTVLIRLEAEARATRKPPVLP